MRIICLVALAFAALAIVDPAFFSIAWAQDAVAPIVAAPEEASPFIFRLAIFVLAIFVGYYVVWSVTPALHTPLMSVTNAISSVIIVGALLALGTGNAAFTSKALGFVAVILAAINIFGGFVVTRRMLAMYKKKQPAKK
jgi:NAD(P) transhydrogenase subunit alpha